MKHKKRKYLVAAYVLFLAAALAVIVYLSLEGKKAPASYSEQVRPVSRVTVSVDGGEPEETSLPAKLSGLAPRTPLTLTAEVPVHPGDSLYFKSVFAPAKLYIDDVLIYESGQPGSYPAYMNDPPTILSAVALPDKEGDAYLRIEYLSPTQRSSLSLPELSVGSGGALLAKQFRADELSLLFSLILIFIGFGMTLTSATVTRLDSSGTAFLWLGLFSLSAGIWVLGECDLTALLLPYPTLLYNMAYMGLFLMTIPFMFFGLVVLKPKNKLPFQITIGVHTAAISAALLLQLSGKMDFNKSLYWFHIITPLGFMVFAGCLLWERFRLHNPAAKRFALAVILLAASTLAELLNYWLRLTDTLTVFFQLGILAFVISLGIASGSYVRDSLNTAAEKIRREGRSRLPSCAAEAAVSENIGE